MLNSHSVQPSPNNSLPESTAAKIGWTILIIVTLGVCYFSHLGAIGFVGPDEPRYAWIARAMYETGDWVTPRLYGQPWFEKPVLYYWGAAASFKLFGVSEAAARLPSALSALLATLALAWLALRLYGKETARWLLLLLPTSVGMIGFSHAASTDMPFSGMLTIAMVCAAVVLGLIRNEHSPVIERTPWLALLGFGFFLGAAVLAKGPAAIILSGGAIFFWAIFTKRWRDAFRLFHPVALFTFFATALPWYILCARRNPTFFHVFIIEHNFNRYLTPEFQHLQPFWYYIPVLLVAFLPWIGILIFSFYSDAKNVLKRNTFDANTIFFWTWVLFCILFFSISHSKLPGYILPAFPAIGLLLGVSVAKSPAESLHKLRLTLYSVSALFLLLAVVAYFMKPNQLRTQAEASTLLATTLVWLSLPVLLLALSLREKIKLSQERSLAFASILVFLAGLSAASAVFPVIDREVSTRQLAHQALAKGLGEKISVYHLNRSQIYSLNFYFHGEVKEWNPSARSDEIVITSGKECVALSAAHYSCEPVEIQSSLKLSSLSIYKITKN